MNNTKNIVELEIINDRHEFSLWLIILIIGLVLLLSNIYIITISDTIEIIQIILISIASILVLVGLFLSNERNYIFIDKYNLVEHKNIFGIHFNKKYEIKEISNLILESNVKSNIYTSQSTFKFGGFEYTPESSKKYYYHKNILSFYHNGKVIEIGKWKKPFNANLILSTINELQRKNS